MAGTNKFPKPMKPIESFRLSFQKTTSKRSKRLGLIFTVFTILSAIGVLGFLIYREQDVLFTYHWKFYPTAFVISLPIYFLSILWATFVWGNIMDRLERKIGYLKHLRYFCIANAAKRLPGTIWYVASRATLYRQEGVDIKLTSMASAMEFALVTLSGIIAAILFSLTILADYQVNPWILGLAFAITLVIIHPKVMSYLFRLLHLEANQFRLTDILVWTASFSLQWVIGGTLLFTTINIIYPLPIQNLGYVLGSWVVVIMVTRLMFFSPSNLGITEIGLSLLLTKLMPTPIAVISALLFRLMVTSLDILLAMAWTLIPTKKFNPLTQKD